MGAHQRQIIGFGVCAALLTTALIAATAAPATASASATTRDTAQAHHSLTKLTATVHFTKKSYRAGATAHVVVRLRNAGAVRLRGIGAECNHAGDADSLNNTGRGWGALAVHGAGITLPAHSTRTVHVTARVPRAAKRSGHVVVACDFGYRGVESGYRPHASARAKVPGAAGALDGDIGYPRSSGAITGVAKVRVVLVDATRCPVLTRTATTSADGRFRIPSAPAGSSYELYVYPPSGARMRGANPTRVMILANDTVRVVITLAHGSARSPAVPTKCS